MVHPPPTATGKNTCADSKGKWKKGLNQGNGAEGERPYPRNRKGLPTNPSDRINHVFTVPSQGQIYTGSPCSTGGNITRRIDPTPICQIALGHTPKTKATGADLAAHRGVPVSI